jgi:hypothetical protein
MKKQRTFTQRWNATALRRIRKAYIKADTFFLCHGSAEFNELWQDHRDKIRECARAAGVNATITDGSSVLFQEPKGLSLTESQAWADNRQQLCIDFLTHENNRLTNK